MIDVRVLIFTVSATLILSGFNNSYAQTSSTNMKTVISFLHINRDGPIPDAGIKGMTIVKNYPITNLIDGKKDTAIVLRNYKEDNPYIEIDFMVPILIDEILIFNGFSKSEDLYYVNSRMKFIMFGLGNQYDKGFSTNDWFINGKQLLGSKGIIVPDKYGSLEIYKSVTNELLLKRLYMMPGSTYKGTKYPNDLCISEIQFWYKGKRYEIANMKEIADGFDYETGMFRSTNSD